MSPQSRSEKLNALLFMGLSTVSGGVFYLYQLLAARLMTPEEFGHFSGWLAWVYLGLAGGAFTQYLGNFFPVQRKGLRSSIGFGALVSFFILMAYFVSTEFDDTKIGWLSIFISPFIGWLQGQTQRRLLLLSFAVGGFVVGVAKLAVVFFMGPVNEALDLSITRTELFYWSLPLSMVAGIAFLALVLSRELKRSPVYFPKADSHIRTRIWGALLLSVFSVFIPNVDLVFVRETQTSEALTQFAQVSLFYKVVFFVILIVAQWLLPRQLNREEEQAPQQRRMKLFARICAMGLMFALCASAVAGQFYKLVLGKEFLAPMIWVFMACFNVSLLTGIFLEVQDQISKLKVSDAAGCLLVQVATVLICAGLKVDLATYLQAQIAVNAILLYLLFLGAGGILTRQVVDQSGHGSMSTTASHK